MKYYFISYDRLDGAGNQVGGGWCVREVGDHSTPIQAVRELESEMSEKFPNQTVMINQFNKVD